MRRSCKDWLLDWTFAWKPKAPPRHSRYFFKSPWEHLFTVGKHEKLNRHALQVAFNKHFRRVTFAPSGFLVMEIDCGFSGSYYDVLGVGPYSSNEDIRRAYRKLAMKWHPDRWMSRPSMFGEAKRNFQMIQQAYEVLSDDGKRLMYDAGVNDPNEAEEEEGFSDFVQEMTSLMAHHRTEKKQDYSLEDLQGMLMEMAQGFDFPQWSDFEPPTNTTFGYSSWPGSIKIGDRRNLTSPGGGIC